MNADFLIIHIIHSRVRLDLKKMWVTADDSQRANLRKTQRMILIAGGLPPPAAALKIVD